MMAISSASASAISRTTTGTSCSLASWAARQRRSPATISKHWHRRMGRTRIGCSMPFSFTELARSLRSSSANCLARLEAVGLQERDRHAARCGACARFAARRHGFFADQRRKAAAQAARRVLPIARPARSCRRPHPFALDQFARQLDIGLAAGTAQIIDQRRQAMARRFGNAHIARDHGR